MLPYSGHKKYASKGGSGVAGGELVEMMGYCSKTPVHLVSWKLLEAEYSVMTALTGCPRTVR